MLRCTERSFCFWWLLRRFWTMRLGGVPGVSVTADSTQTSALTLHGDHLFNGFPEGDEGDAFGPMDHDCDLVLMVRSPMMSFRPCAFSLPVFDTDISWVVHRLPRSTICTITSQLS